MSSDDQWTVRRILDWTINYLKEQGSESPRLEAEILLAHARNCRRIQLYTQFDQPLTDQERGVMRNLVKRRGAAEPVAYLVGHKEFFSLDFLVRPGVLIPRPETEVLVSEALDAARTIPVPRVLDLCTGSGCVGIAIAKNAPAAQVTAVELHEPALAAARENVERNGVQGRVMVLQGDLYAPIPSGERFELIVSNPPYVAQSEISELPRDVRDHEPHSALDGGPDGLDVIRKIVEDAPAWLAPGGRLLLEFSPEQAGGIRDLCERRGFANTAIKNDLAGRPRVIAARLPTANV